jgi:hypothetical protein
MQRVRWLLWHTMTRQYRLRSLASLASREYRTNKTHFSAREPVRREAYSTKGNNPKSNQCPLRRAKCNGTPTLLLYTRNRHILCRAGWLVSTLPKLTSPAHTIFSVPARSNSQICWDQTWITVDGGETKFAAHVEGVALLANPQLRLQKRLAWFIGGVKVSSLLLGGDRQAAYGARLHAASIAAASLMIWATFSTVWLASVHSPAMTVSRIAGKCTPSSADHRGGPKMTCLNWVRLGICLLWCQY